MLIKKFSYSETNDIIPPNKPDVYTIITTESQHSEAQKTKPSLSRTQNYLFLISTHLTTSAVSLFIKENIVLMTIANNSRDTSIL